MDILRNPPTPLIDNLQYQENPFTQVEKIIQRAQVPAKIRKEDLFHSLSFLTSYNGSQATYNSYRREIERLLQWCWFIQDKQLIDLKRQDIEAYIEFVQSPPLAWIGTKQVARFKNKQGERCVNPDWRPFVAQISKVEAKSGRTPEHRNFQLSQKALQAVFAVLSTYFNYLLQEDYCKINPVALIRQKSKYLQRHAYQEPVKY